MELTCVIMCYLLIEGVEVVILLELVVFRLFLKPTPAVLTFCGSPCAFLCIPTVDNFRCWLVESTYSAWGSIARWQVAGSSVAVGRSVAVGSSRRQFEGTPCGSSKALLIEMAVRRPHARGPSVHDKPFFCHWNRLAQLPSLSQGFES